MNTAPATAAAATCTTAPADTLPPAAAAPSARTASAAAPAHFAHWPQALAHHLTLPETHIFYNAEVSAARYPNKPFLVFYGAVLTFADFKRQAEQLAGHLQHACGVQRGDRVLLCMQNSPQWAVAFYAITRANAVVVPVNPMNRTEELRHCMTDSGASVAVIADHLLAEFAPLLSGNGHSIDHSNSSNAPPTATAPHTDSNSRSASPGAAPATGHPGLCHTVVATYSDALSQPPDVPAPEVVTAPRQPLTGSGLTAWSDALASGHTPGPITTGPDDLCVMPYTSGTTGAPKGCMHTHRTLMSTVAGGVSWFSRTPDSVYLSVLPFFHVTGLVGGLHGPLYLGSTTVLLSRWDREAAAASIARHRVNVWQAISTMVIDFLANPRLDQHDLSSLNGIRGGGAAMPAAVHDHLKALTGVAYVEGYGMTETMGATHINPPQNPKRQCLGIPVFDVEARVIDPVTFAELPVGETGEIVMHGPQVMLGYWGKPEATAKTFIELDGKRFLRSGDLGHVDGDGYFFMTDRLKRMINASGYKVWPAEVESLLYHHPGIQEACVIATTDAHRGESVKAMVVLKASHQDTVSPDDIIAWAHGHMAPYKAPRKVELVASLPKSGTGKVMWRALQEREAQRAASPEPSH